MKIELKDMSFSYQDGKNRKQIFDNFSLEVGEGEFLVILGASGCGKTTLLNIMGGLLKAESGTIMLGDTDYYSLSKRRQDKFRKNHIGYVFQSFYLIDDLNPIDNVMLTMHSKKNIKEKQKDIHKIFESVGLTDKMQEKIKTFSGGEQQRLAIARAVAQDSDILICDEPTGNLDEENSIQIMKILSELNKRGKTIIMVTHNKELCSYASRIIELTPDVRLGGENATNCTYSIE